MHPTSADILMSSADAPSRTDRATQMPFLGLFTGLALALVMWSAIGWLVLALLD